KVTPKGVISTVAGTGTAGFSGDGGLAIAAQMSSPTGVAVDGAGNLYVADSNNNRGRAITIRGTISTIPRAGVKGNTGNGGAASAAQIGTPYSLAFDTAGNLYIGDSFGIRRVSNGTITKVVGIVVAGRGNSCQFAGDGGPAISASVCSPRGIAADAAGN